MPARDVVVGSRIGLHQRPAKTFVELAQTLGVPVRISKGDKAPVDATSILAVLMLGAKGGETVRIEATGDGADDALDKLATLLATDLDAE